MKDFGSINQLKHSGIMNRCTSILFMLLALTACSGGEDAGQVSKAEQKQPEGARLADQITKQNLIDASEASSRKLDAVGEPNQVLELRNEVSDDAVAESADEAAADEFDEYAYVEPNEGSTVKLLERNEGYIEWQAPSDIAYKQTDIVIVDESGERVNYTFAADEAMVLDSSLPDGLYKWESVVTPEIDPYVMDQMKSARASGDLQAQKNIKQKLHDEGSLPDGFGSKDNRQSGAFVVRDGVVTPTSSHSDGQDE